ncbi:hypothetical protein C8R46DRAFT_1030688 [Mycena filopes]|nr:hypothetical protein C8R46DRAFT_1030688 [Mycena filopes]
MAPPTPSALMDQQPARRTTFVEVSVALTCCTDLPLADKRASIESRCMMGSKTRDFSDLEAIECQNRKPVVESVVKWPARKDRNTCPLRKNHIPTLGSPIAARRRTRALTSWKDPTTPNGQIAEHPRMSCGHASVFCSSSAYAGYSVYALEQLRARSRSSASPLPVTFNGITIQPDTHAKLPSTTSCYPGTIELAQIRATEAMLVLSRIHPLPSGSLTRTSDSSSCRWKVQRLASKIITGALRTTATDLLDFHFNLLPCTTGGPPPQPGHLQRRRPHPYPPHLAPTPPHLNRGDRSTLRNCMTTRIAHNKEQAKAEMKEGRSVRIHGRTGVAAVVWGARERRMKHLGEQGNTVFEYEVVGAILTLDIIKGTPSTFSPTASPPSPPFPPRAQPRQYLPSIAASSARAPHSRFASTRCRYHILRCDRGRQEVSLKSLLRLRPKVHSSRKAVPLCLLERIEPSSSTERRILDQRKAVRRKDVASGQRLSILALRRYNLASFTVSFTTPGAVHGSEEGEDKEGAEGIVGRGGKGVKEEDAVEETVLLHEVELKLKGGTAEPASIAVAVFDLPVASTGPRRALPSLCMLRGEAGVACSSAARRFLPLDCTTALVALVLAALVDALRNLEVDTSEMSEILAECATPFVVRNLEGDASRMLVEGDTPVVGLFWRRVDRRTKCTRWRASKSR